MARHYRQFKLLLVLSLGTALSACSQSHQVSHSAHYGAGSSYAGYNSDAVQYGAGYSQNYSSEISQSRYGYEASASLLRPSCGNGVQPCGFMQVVPVYPIYQVPMQQAAAPEPVVKAPEVILYDKQPELHYYEPEPYIEPYVEPIPEPVHTPPSFWPEPETPVQSWKPIRK